MKTDNIVKNIETICAKLQPVLEGIRIKDDKTYHLLLENICLLVHLGSRDEEGKRMYLDEFELLTGQSLIERLK